jgi:hypothetical protein
VRLARTAKLFELPIVLSTVNVGTDRSKGTVPDLLAELPGVDEIDQTQINAWEDTQFRATILASGRKKLIMTALWTEACLSFPSLEACAGVRDLPGSGRSRRHVDRSAYRCDQPAGPGRGKANKLGASTV